MGDFSDKILALLLNEIDESNEVLGLGTFMLFKKINFWLNSLSYNNLAYLINDN